MEQVSDEELDHGAEEDSDKEDQDLDKMFGAWLGELDKLTQVKKNTHRERRLMVENSDSHRWKGRQNERVFPWQPLHC